MELEQYKSIQTINESSVLAPLWAGKFVTEKSIPRFHYSSRTHKNYGIEEYFFRCAEYYCASNLVIKPNIAIESNNGSFSSSDIIAPAYELTEKVESTLGENGVNRFYEFKDKYKNGWDYGRGKSLSFYSTGVLILFINHFDDFPCEPSLFLSISGNLQLCWEDKKREIEIEFSLKGFEYYIEAINQEGIKPLDKIKDLIKLLNI